MIWRPWQPKKHCRFKAKGAGWLGNKWLLKLSSRVLLLLYQRAKKPAGA